ncbi:Transcription elongation factor SPT6 [Operophtera brumata]|uniref:Transcription elongation factor SPT6 n=1 Tax=Operophtera brumata TaxID=104452 RepID=A0A0L7LL20_OPEBR|nr:Transcription elongation factor SPT6 [Operophtera brumata]
MADFLESEAEESEVDSEDDQPEQPRKKPKRKAAVQSDDEDDDEDDEERLREELKDLIDDAPIEESGSDGEDSDASNAGPKKRKKSDDELDDRLEDEDYDLIEENLGVKVARNKFKRLRRLEDDDSDNEGNDDPDLEREVIAEKLFVGGSDDEEDHRPEPAPQREVEYDDDADDSLQEGQDIFGVDFDYEEFEKYGDGEDYEDEDEEDLDEYIEDDDEEGLAGERRRTKKGKPKRPSKKSIFEIYEPSELKRSHFTDLDNEIRKTDVPERMQIREVPITPVEEGSTELEDEAEWIYKQAFLKPPVSKADSQEARERSRRGSSTVTKIRQALDFMRNQTLEVPFIAFYRKEYVQPELSINDLWKVYKYDAKWCQLKQRKENLMKLLENMRELQLDKEPSSRRSRKKWRGHGRGSGRCGGGRACRRGHHGCQMGSIASAQEVLRRAVYMCGVQLARDPQLRATLRDALRERATVTKKPVRDLTGDQFLKLSIAAEDKLLELSISEQIEGNTGPMQAWNELRAEAVTIALTKIMLSSKTVRLVESRSVRVESIR